MTTLNEGESPSNAVIIQPQITIETDAGETCETQEAENAAIGTAIEIAETALVAVDTLENRVEEIAETVNIVEYVTVEQGAELWTEIRAIKSELQSLLATMERMISSAFTSIQQPSPPPLETVEPELINLNVVEESPAPKIPRKRKWM